MKKKIRYYCDGCIYGKKDGSCEKRGNKIMNQNDNCSCKKTKCDCSWKHGSAIGSLPIDLNDNNITFSGIHCSNCNKPRSIENIRASKGYIVSMLDTWGEDNYKRWYDRAIKLYEAKEAYK